MSRTSWQRVSRRRPCVVCERTDWCLFTGDHDHPDAVICARMESHKRCGEAGWLHVLRNDGPTWSPRVRRIELSARRIALTPGYPLAGASPENGRGEIDFARMAADFRAAVGAPPGSEALARLAAGLGVSAESLGRLGVGWSARHRAWTFPMVDVDGHVLGIRLRCPGGKKLSVRGGREGLFIPSVTPEPSPPAPLPHRGEGRLLLVCEGPTDTAALLDLGFSAVGRPSCLGGVKLLVELVQRVKPADVVIVGDRDAPGQRGAESLAAVLVAYCPALRIIAPPAGIKDAREWRRRGATRADVQSLVDAVQVRNLKVTIRKAGAHNGK